jgi:hypothetical protein
LLEKVSPDITALAATARSISDTHGEDVLQAVLLMLLQRTAPRDGDEE